MRFKVEPEERGDANSRLAHIQMVEKARKGRIDLYFLGDSIVRRWGCSDMAYRHFYAHWRESFWGWNAGNFGWGGDRTAHVLWRVLNGELEGVLPKVVVVHCGTNDLGAGRSVEETAAGVVAVVEAVRGLAPGVKVLVTGVFLRTDVAGLAAKAEAVNRLVEGVGDEFLDLNTILVDGAGAFLPGMMGSDGLHPELGTYRVWAEGLRPRLEEWLGPRGMADCAPPATGDPSAK